MLTGHDDTLTRHVDMMTGGWRDLLALALLAARMAGSVARLATPLGEVQHYTLYRHMDGRGHADTDMMTC